MGAQGETWSGRAGFILAAIGGAVGLGSIWKFPFEVGVHGLYHDGRDLESLETLRERLPEMRAYAEHWGSVGFRSPATHRCWEWMPTLGFDYDSSYPDTDPFEPQGGGCCSLLPFFNEGLVELPITLPQDHTLFVILQNSCNTAFAQMGVEQAQASGMTATAEAYGFNQPVPIDLPDPASSRWPAEVVADNPPFLAQASIGQNEVQSTPLQMALVAAAVANDGKVMRPHVMREIRDDQDNVVGYRLRKQGDRGD